MRNHRTSNHVRAGASGLLIVAAAIGSGCNQMSRAPEPVAETVTEPAPPLRQGGADVAPGGIDAEAAKEAARAAAQTEAQTEAQTTDPAAAQGDAGTDDSKAPARPKSVTDVALELEASTVLDDWHNAASVGDRDRYVGHFAPDAVFLGTDETERWDLATFTAYVDEHFRPGKGWSYTPFNRYVMLSPARDLAWFDEQLDSAGYGALRGTGVLRREEDSWKIVHYSMTFTIPNEVARDVVGVVRNAPR